MHHAVHHLPLYRPNRKMPLRQLRRAVQLGALALWVALFVATRDTGMRLGRVDLFLLTDPLVAALVVGAARVIVVDMAFALVLVALTLVLGRAFCGWLCPLGTLIDVAAKILKPREDRLSVERHVAMQRWKYLILALMTGGALLSAQWVYLLDPLVLLFRAIATGVYPVLALLLPPAIFGDKLAASYHGAVFAPILLLIVILALTAITPRFYCRYLCPLGAFYGLLSRRPILRRRVTGCDACNKVQTDMQCVGGCRMGAVPKPPYTENHECIRCLSGRSFCHAEAIHFDWLGPKLERKDASLDLSRRGFLVTAATGVGLAPVAAFSAYHRGDPKQVIRPPRVTDEDEFVDQCIRCAMCVQACPTQTLQLTHLESGVAGFWTPAVTPGVNGCIAQCNACAIACPTDAIPDFTKAEADKWAVKMGTATLEKNRCISYTEGKPCAKCLDICPTKAFFVEAEDAQHVRRPWAVDYVRCVGCGLCEWACAKIVFGAPALVTSSHGRGQPTTLALEPSDIYLAPHR
jgi:polyferredoxin